MRLSLGGDEWEETRLVLLGELFGTNACAWLTEGTKGAGEEWCRVQKHPPNRLWCSQSDG